MTPASNTAESVTMKSSIAAGILSLFSISAAYAQSPVGEWVVEDGTAHIRIVPCGNALWGVISWTKDTPGRDEHNPDPSKRSRSVLGMPILINMKPAGTRWEGEVYNAENGETYTSHISLENGDVLRIEGCVFGGFICGGENWRRVPPTKSGPSDQDVCSRVGK
jgi:uncharacterized protein (DUF2147 family)